MRRLGTDRLASHAKLCYLLPTATQLVPGGAGIVDA
jgi:hypothetical protein